jgi:hypothetical protein
MLQECLSLGSTAGYLPSLRVDGDVLPMLPHATMTFACSFDRLVIDILPSH